MEQWASNTLRTLGIILIAGFVLVTSLFLLLLSFCSWQGGFSGSAHPDQGVAYLVAAVMVMVIGSLTSGWLARGMVRSSAAAELAAAPQAASALGSASSSPSVSPADARLSVPLHLSPLGRKAIDRLVLALVAQIVLSALSWFWSQFHLWTTPRAFAPHNWTLVLLAPFVLYHVPYAMLIYSLLKKPDRRAFAYSLAVPAILVLQAWFSLSLVAYAYIRHPAGLLLVFLPWAIHIVVLVLAWKAIQQVGIHPDPSSLMVAALVTFVYFSFIHLVTPFLYRLAWSFHG